MFNVQCSTLFPWNNTEKNKQIKMIYTNKIICIYHFYTNDCFSIKLPFHNNEVVDSLSILSYTYIMQIFNMIWYRSWHQSVKFKGKLWMSIYSTVYRISELCLTLYLRRFLLRALIKLDFSADHVACIPFYIKCY